MTMIFKFPGMPSSPTRKELVLAVVTILDKYRTANHILPTEQLTPRQVDEVLDGVKSLIYEHEELRYKSHDDSNEEEDSGNVM